MQKKVFLLAFCVWGLAACDKATETVDAAIDTIDTAVQSATKKIESPMVRTRFEVNENTLDSMWVLDVLAQEDNTEIKEVIINRGNCPIITAKRKKNLFDGFVTPHQGGVLSKLGDRIDPIDQFYDTPDDRIIWDALDETERLQWYKEVGSPLPQQLQFSQKISVVPSCGNDVLEVQVVTNGGTFDFEMKK